MLNDDLEKKRKELELMLSVEHQMSDTSKNRLILKLLDLFFVLSQRYIFFALFIVFKFNVILL